MSLMSAAAVASEPPPPPGPEAWAFRKELAEDPPPPFEAPKGTPWLENRISRCFFSPIKRPPFNRDELKDDIDYYPANYLERLRREGVNGLWLSLSLDDLDDASLAKLRRTVESAPRTASRSGRSESSRRTVRTTTRFSAPIRTRAEQEHGPAITSTARHHRRCSPSLRRRWRG